MLSQEPTDPPRDRESSPCHTDENNIDVGCTAISIQSYIDPGAGLKHLEDWVQDSDFIFDSMFMNSTGPATGRNYDYASNISGADTPSPVVPMARTYRSDAAM